jgi:predicted Mrr-cat superfamily restriction endonuclease
MEQVTLKMQQETKVHWRYEWPLNRKVKWHVQKLLARKMQQELRKWLRQVENLSDIEEKVIHICEPEIGRNLREEEEVRSVKGLINCQEGIDESSNRQVDNEMRSIEDLIDFQEGSSEISYFQVAMR